MSTTSLAAPAAPPPTRARRRRPSPSRLSFLRRWASPIAIIAVWQLLSSTGLLTEDTIASPAQIAAAAADLIADGTLQAAILASLQRVGLGFLIGASIGLVVAIAAGLSRLGEDALDPPMQMLRTLPHFGLIPLFITWFGIGESPKLALIAMGVAFPLYLNTFGGIRNIDQKTNEAATAMGLTWPQRIRHVVIPGALPQTLIGLRQSLGIAWLSLIVAETISASSGLGYMINQAKEFQQTDVIVVGLAVYSLLGLATDALVRIVERKALTWRS
jgi:sulfonate transport system permease protein